MSIITAYRSDADGKLFEDKKKYVSHLKKLAKARLLEKKISMAEIDRDQFLNCMGQVESIADLEKFIKDNWKWFWLNGIRHNIWRDESCKHIHEYVDVSFRDVLWKENVSNSHSCPRGGVENFDSRADCNKDKPTSYPGWISNITIKVRPPMSKHKINSYMHNGFGSDYFSRTIIHTGTGGGGGGKDCKEYRYGVTLWAADFPVMYEKLRHKQYIENENNKRMFAWKTLGGSNNVPLITEVPEDWVCPSPWP